MAEQVAAKKLTALSKVGARTNIDLYDYLLLEGETVVLEYKAMRDILVFTSSKVIGIDVQGLTGKKKDFLVIPYSKITAFSVESAGSWDLDAECKIWSSGIGHIELEFIKGTDIREIAALLASKVK